MKSNYNDKPRVCEPGSIREGTGQKMSHFTNRHTESINDSDLKTRQKLIDRLLSHKDKFNICDSRFHRVENLKEAKVKMDMIYNSIYENQNAEYKDILPHALGININHTHNFEMPDLSIFPNLSELFSFDTDTMLSVLNSAIAAAVLISIYRLYSPKDKNLSYWQYSILSVCLIMLSIIQYTCSDSGTNLRYMRLFQPIIDYFDRTDLIGIDENEIIDMEITSQAMDIHMTEVGSFLTVMLTFISGYSAKSRLIDGVMSATKTTSIQSNNMSMTLITGMDMIKKFLVSIDQHEMSQYFYVDTFTTESLRDFSIKVRKFISKINAANTMSSHSFQDIYHSLINENKDLLKLVDKHSFDFKELMKTHNELIELEKKVSAISSTLNGQRVEPVGVLLRGLPKTYKSVLLGRIATAVASLTLPEEWKEDFSNNPKQFIWPVPKDKFYDGYSYKAWVAKMDDVFQARDVAGDPESEAMKIIGLINVESFPLHMAEVSSKNKMFFRSPFVMATTNLMDFSRLESIRNSSAVERRFTVELDVKENEDFGKLPVLDVEVEDEVISGSHIPNEFWDITMTVKAPTGKFVYRNVTVEEVVFQILSLHKDRIVNHYVNMESNKIIQAKLKELSSSESISKSLASKRILTKTFVEPQGLSFSQPVLDVPIITNPVAEQIVSMIDRIRTDVDELALFRSHWIEIQMRFVGGVFGDLNMFWRHLNTAPRNIQEIYLNSYTLNGVHGLLDTIRMILNSDFMHDREFQSWDKLPQSVIWSNVSANVLRNYMNVITFLADRKWWIIAVGFLILYIKRPLINMLKKLSQLGKFSKKGKSQSSLDINRDRGKMRDRPGKKATLRDFNHKIDPQVLRLGPNGNIDSLDFPRIDLTHLGNMRTSAPVLTSVMNKYVYILYLVTDDKVERVGHMLNIKSNVFMMPYHYILLLSEVFKKKKYEVSHLEYTTPSGKTRYTTSLKDFFSNIDLSPLMMDKDLAFFRPNTAHRSSVGALKHFLKDRDVERLNKNYTFRGSIIGANQQGNDSSALIINNIQTDVSVVENVVVKASWLNNLTDEPLEAYYIPKTFGYKGNFKSGDCGSLLSVEAKNFENRCLVGIHVAGSSDEGYSTVVSQEFLIKTMEELYGEHYSLFDSEQILDSEVELPIESQGSLLPVATLTGNDIPGDIFKSELKKSIFYNKLPEPFHKNKLFPARIKTFIDQNGDYIDPLAKARDKYRVPPILINQEFVIKAINNYEILINENLNTKREFRKPISVKEALHSFGNVSAISPSTSPGYPMCLAKNDNLKEAYYNACERNDEIDKDKCYLRIANLVNDNLQLYKSKIRPRFYYKDCLKDELVTLERVLIGKTRMFSACDFILLVLFRMYFGEFISAYFDANLNVGSAIGVNPYSSSWNDLASKLNRHRMNKDDAHTGAGDFAGYDTRQYNDILWQIFHMINRWYGDGNYEDSCIRAMLFTEIVESVHVSKNEVFEWNTGIPSGNPMTAIINTIYNNIIFRIAYQEAGLDIKNFNDNVYICALGDDNVFSVDQSDRDQFNELNMPNLMSKCGMKYTTELKETATLKSRPIDDISFLKRTFRYDRTLNRYVAPLELNACFDTLHWTKKGSKMGEDPDQISVDKLLSTIRELSLHGREVFDKFVPELLEMKNKYAKGIKPKGYFTTDYDEVYNDTLSTEYNF